MLGEMIGESRGKISGMRVLPSQGQSPVVEVSFQSGGKLLGQIEELLIDARSGCVQYAVLARGGFLGIGRKRVAVPWSALTPDADDRRCIVDVTLMRLMAVPVSQGEPSPRRVNLSWSKEGSYMLRQQGFLGATRDKHPGSRMARLP